VSRFVSMMWSEDVRSVEAAMAVQIVQELISSIYREHWPMGVITPPVGLRAFGTWALRGAPEGSPYWGTQWYVDQSYDPSVDKIVGSRFLSLVEAEPWQQSDRHYDMALVAKDIIASDELLITDPSSSVLGAALPGLAAVISLYQLRGILGAHEWQLAMRRLVLHFFGHVIGLPSGPYAERDEPYHCENVCAMRDATDSTQLLRLAEEEAAENVSFCRRCGARLRSIVVGHHFGPN
jgi:hypothetical protein